MVLKTLHVLGPLHGYGIARRIGQISGDLLSLNQGTLYLVLLRLEQEPAIASEWGPSENSRRARLYRLTRAGDKLLEAEKRDWEQTAAIIARFFAMKAGSWHESPESVTNTPPELHDQAPRRPTAQRRD
jgi:PadR family transcriptional regulator PadR